VTAPPTEPHLSHGPVVVTQAVLWHTHRRARHGQLFLRSPGSGVRHRRL